MKILCLPGTCNNSEMMRRYCKIYEDELGDKFEFVYYNPPKVCND